MAAPTKNFTSIPDSDIDANSPVDATLKTEERDNDIHNYEWIGGSYTPAIDHDHDGVNSAAVGAISDEFTASGTWTKPPGATKVLFRIWAAGGSGGRNNGTNAGGGGGGGAYVEAWFDADDLSATEAITIGAGAVGVSADVDGNVGGDTTVGSVLTAYGGGGGEGGSRGGGGGGSLTAGGTPSPGAPPSYAGNGGAADTAGQAAHFGGAGGGGGGGLGNVGGDAFYGGAGGGSGRGDSSGNSLAGGTSIYGGDGGDGGFDGSNGTAGTQPGGGGGGCETAGTSGAGADGKAIAISFTGG